MSRLAVVLAYAALVALVFGIQTVAHQYLPPLPTCAQEDSENCIWDASVDGNGLGRSLVNIEGDVYYLDTP